MANLTEWANSGERDVIVKRARCGVEACKNLGRRRLQQHSLQREVNFSMQHRPACCCCCRRSRLSNVLAELIPSLQPSAFLFISSCLPRIAFCPTRLSLSRLPVDSKESPSRSEMQDLCKLATLTSQLAIHSAGEFNMELQCSSND